MGLGLKNSMVRTTIKAATDQALDRIDRPVGRCQHMSLGRLSDDIGAIVVLINNGGKDFVALPVLEDSRAPILKHCHNSVGGPKVNADCAAHPKSIIRQSVALSGLGFNPRPD